MILTPKVSRGGDLVLRVETRDSGGAVVEGISFMWYVDWATVKGSRHKGQSFENLMLRCKGSPGKGEVRAYAYNDNGGLVEVARAAFVIE